MKTTRPQSTISYNSMGFLLGVLDNLVEKEFITFYAVIEHQAEEDENKDHIHVYFEPAKTLDTLWLAKQFLEVDPKHPKQPLKCMPFQASKWVDWYWYGLHDKAYLMSKQMTRKYHYESSQMITSDVDYLAEKVRQNPNPMSRIAKTMELLSQGYNPIEIAMMSNTPIQMLNYYMNGVQMIAEYMNANSTNRAGRLGHENDKIADENGEIVHEQD